MPVYVRDGGVWKEAAVYVRDGGVWKQADLSVRDGGAWKVAAVVVTVSAISPAAQELSGSVTSRTFGACSLSVTGGSPSSITWSFIDTDGGNFIIDSGQGTLTATPRVTNVLSGSTATATFRCTVVVNGQSYVRDCFLSYINDNLS